MTSDNSNSSAQSKGGSYLDAARRLAPQVLAAADLADRERELPAKLANAIKDQGLFRLLVPQSIGGGEIDYLEFLDIVEVFAKADGSTAWCVNQNNVFATSSATMPKRLAQEIWSDRRAVVSNGPPTSADAVPEGDGYRLTGRWNFSSGARHATWVAAVAPIRNPECDEEDREVRTMLLPKEHVNLVDVWQVNGLRGTGSVSFEVQDLHVSKSRTFRRSDEPREAGPLYVMPMVLLFASGFATVALGIARAGLDAAIEVAGSKTPQGRALLREEPDTWRQIGQAEAIWRSARAFLRESASAAWKSAREVRSLTLEERIRLRLAGTHGIRMAAQVVDIAYTLFGSHAIFENNPIQRRFQDVHAITQQLQGRMDHYDTAGQFFLGLEPQGIF